MRSQPFQLASSQKAPWHIHAWLPEGPARACVQIVHGMAEHGGRYAYLAHALTTQGYAVYAQDLPGHGHSVASEAERGHDADHGGWALAQRAIHRVRAEIGARHGALPLVMLGHSRGSFLLQAYLLDHAAGLAGAVLSSGTASLGAARLPGLWLMQIEARLRGAAHRSALAEKLTFARFNRQFAPNRTAFDWLSRDPAQVDAYIADPLCGFRCSAALWRDLLREAGKLGNPARLAALPKDLPLLLLNGSDDPAANGATGAQRLLQRYQQAGLTRITAHVEAQGRHELFNDVCADAITARLSLWLSDVMVT